MARGGSSGEAGPAATAGLGRPERMARGGSWGSSPRANTVDLRWPGKCVWREDSREVKMSLMGRKSRSYPSVATAAQRARDAATQVVPMAKNAVPMAKNVGLTAKQSAEEAVARVAPRVKDARAWAAPQVEQAGLAVRDKIAPAISKEI